EIEHEGHVLPYRQFDKMRQVNQPAIVENKHLDAALLLARQMQAIMPHHRKRNNDAPARRDQPMHLFPEPEPPAKIDRRKLGGSKLKRGPRLSDEALHERGTLRFVQRT
ncbi:ISNCY family transposase, partial [Sphingomonas sp. HH69]